jgi:Dynamin GTPase effector domain
MIIDYHLLKGFNRTVHDFLFKQLALGEEGARERCATYLEEEPEVVTRRTTLSSMLNRMETARVELQKVSCQYLFSRGSPTKSYSQALASTSITIDAADDISAFSPLPPDPLEMDANEY